MKQRYILVIASLIFSITTIAQQDFKKGYFINENNVKTECLILDEDWSTNPSQFTYKLSEDSEIKIATIKDINEVIVPDKFKYIRRKVKIDRSSDKLNNLTDNGNLNLNNEILFLKVLIEGKASLYRYNDGTLTRYFYKVGDEIIQQLVYKKYLSDDKILENNHFKNQIFNDVNCNNTSSNSIKALTYKQNSLVKYFKEYNECENALFVDYTINKNKGDFNVSVKAGVSSTSIYNRSFSDRLVSFKGDNKLLYRVGVEFEYIFGFNKSKWSVILEPTYNSKYVSDNIININATGIVFEEDVHIEYSSFSLPFGLRYSFYLPEKTSKIYMDIGYTTSFTNKKSFMEVEKSKDFNAKARNSQGFFVGAGFKFKKSISVEIRYDYLKDVMDNSTLRENDNLQAKVNSVSFILGYTFL